jgi:prevent-host-death family protein
MYIFRESRMSKVNVTELRQNLPAYLDQVKNGTEVQITVHGKVVARLVPEQGEQSAARQRLDALRGKCRIGDVVSPLPEEWDAGRGTA